MDTAVIDAPVLEHATTDNDAVFDAAPSSQAPKPGLVSFADAFKGQLEEKTEVAKPQHKSQEKQAEKPKEQPKPEAKPAESRQRDTETGRFKAFQAPESDGDAEAPAKPDKDENIRNLRQTKEALEAKVRQYESQRLASVDPGEVETLKTKLTDYEKTIARLRYEESPEYRTKFQEPLNEIVKSASELVDPSLQTRLAFVLEMLPGQNRTQALQKLIEESPDAVRFEILGLAREAAKITIERQKAIGNPQARMEEIQRQEQSRRAAEQEQERRFVDELITGTAEEAAKMFPGFFGQKDGDEGHNAAVRERLKAVRSFMIPEGNDPERPTKIAEAAFYSVIGRESAPLISKLEKELAKATKELETLRGSRPSINGSQTQPGGERKSFLSVAKDAWQNGTQ